MSRAATLAHELNTALNTTVVKLGSDKDFRIVRVPTGSLVIDRITGGGFALGRHYELFGDESACKSYICYRTIALSQTRGKICAVVDPEHSFDQEWFEWLGGDSESLLLLHPENAEEAVAVMMMLAKHSEERSIEVVMMDSVSSLVPREEMDNDVRTEDRIAGQARMMSRALRRITTVNKQTLFLWINQERTNVGIRFGNPNTTSGGRALRFYATGRIEMRRGTRVKAKRKVARAGKLVESDVTIGRWINLRAEKEKSTRPLREGSFIFNNEMNAIDIASEVIQLGLEDGIIERSANGRFSYVDLEEHEWKGTEKQFSKMIREDEELQAELVAEIQDNTVRDARGEDTDG